ncbi:DMT family transporter [Flavobacterium cerinum]|uniref:SMR family transporter n=1 Tax=Flavobacterium cerinum TaxID=2502784 RepID=A0ABY5IRS3_9FLAO|nr:SMR family transporter [Flavobacterium cerinum]UUC44966.1 SMR family transporter [Flavobacterium cerinum]
MKYLFLLIAIIFEVIATSALKSSEQFTRLWPSVISVLGYAAAFYFLSLTLKTLPIGIAYAIWSGLGIVLISGIGYLVYNQSLDFPAVIGILFIIIGVLIINLYSNSVSH